jgi:hypothetical protein
LIVYIGVLAFAASASALVGETWQVNACHGGAVVDESAGVKWAPPFPEAKRPMSWTRVNGRLKAINIVNQLQLATAGYLDRREAKREGKRGLRS